MPPKKERLPDTVIADFRRWIERGGNHYDSRPAVHRFRSRAAALGAAKAESSPAAGDEQSGMGTA
jgi:hypothetical protein